MRDFVENEVGSLRDHGAPGISWALLVLCFALAFSPAPQPAGDRAASGSAEVEVETGPEMPVVALTFDDGPRAATTGRLLDELALREVPATFFLLGHRLSGNEELVRRMAREGHQIGVHTFDHVPVTGLSHQEFDLQVGGVRAQLRDILGDGEFWLRPPYGQTDDSTRAWADSPIVLWSVDPEDWKVLDADKVSEHVCSHVQDGDIILLHDFYPTSVEAALRIVDRLQEEGYEFVTVEELLRLNGTKAEAGKLYRNAWEERL